MEIEKFRRWGEEERRQFYLLTARCHGRVVPTIPIRGSGNALCTASLHKYTTTLLTIFL